MDQSTKEVRLAQWAKLIQQCNQSGLSKKVWCEQNQINEKTFYYRQRHVRNALYDQQAEPATAAHNISFVAIPAIRERSAHNEAIVAVIRMEGYQIELSNTASREFLHHLLEAFAYVQ